MSVGMCQNARTRRQSSAIQAETLPTLETTEPLHADNRPGRPVSVYDAWLRL